MPRAEPKRLIDLLVTFRWKWDRRRKRWGRMVAYDGSSDYRSGRADTAWFTWQPQFGLSLIHLNMEGDDLPDWCGESPWDFVRLYTRADTVSSWAMTFPGGVRMIQTMMAWCERRIARLFAERGKA